MTKKPEQQRQIIHLHLLMEDGHYYFGSISAIYDHFTRDQIGVAQQTLYNLKLVKPYVNHKVVIRQGRLIQKRNLNKRND